MLTSREIRVLHLEPTDVCQASCPACARETDPDFDSRDQHHLTLDMINQSLSSKFIQQLHKMFICGNFDAQGRVSPCCWLGNRQRDFVSDFEEIKQSWSGPDPNAVCLTTCGTDGMHTNFSNRWQREVAF